MKKSILTYMEKNPVGSRVRTMQDRGKRHRKNHDIMATTGRRKIIDCRGMVDAETIQEITAAEEKIQERIDDQGHRWRKVYVGGGEHFRNWLAQCRELGEVLVEEVDSTGYQCFEESGETLYRIWVKTDPKKKDHLF